MLFLQAFFISQQPYYVKQGRKNLFTLLPDVSAIVLKRLIMFHCAVLALYFFSGRVPL